MLQDNEGNFSFTRGKPTEARTVVQEAFSSQRRQGQWYKRHFRPNGGNDSGKRGIFVPTEAMTVVQEINQL